MRNLIIFEESYVNSNVTSSITGASLIFNYTINHKLMVKLFGNIQSTILEGFTPTNSSLFTLSEIDLVHKTTPSSYGGVSINYIPIKKWNIYSNLYAMDNQQFYSIDGILPLNRSWIWNMKLSYTFYKDCKVFLNGRNLLMNNHIEFPFADKKATMILLGLNLKY